jgi:hypothetical protein
VTGRYVESDPIGLAVGLNTYLYVDANPAVNTHTSGLVTDRWRTCSRAERQQCQADCASQGKEYESCRFRQRVHDTIRNGTVLPEIYDVPGGLSCSCKEKRELCETLTCRAGLILLGVALCATPIIGDEILVFGAAAAGATAASQ